MVATNPQSIPRISAVDCLHPIFRERLERGVTLARAEGLPACIFETYRDPARQEQLYASGRTRPGKILTNARGWSSWHQYAVAVDIAFDGDVSTEKVEWTWDGNWRRLGEIMTAQGLEWLGSPGSSFPEAPHFQLTGSVTLMVAKILYSEGGLEAVWEKITSTIGGSK